MPLVPERINYILLIGLDNPFMSQPDIIYCVVSCQPSHQRVIRLLVDSQLSQLIILLRWLVPSQTTYKASHNWSGPNRTCCRSPCVWSGPNRTTLMVFYLLSGVLPDILIFAVC